VTDFGKHVLRCGLGTALLVACLPWPPLAALAALWLFLATFALFHDAAHGALGLPARLNDALLCMTSVPLFMSSHGQRHLHLRHHARPLADDDLEGRGAVTSLPVAVLEAPLSSARMRVVGLVAVPDRVRPWVIAENLLNLATVVVVLATGHPGLQATLAAWVLLQLTMNAWASHIPHRAPRWLIAIAGRFAWTGSPVVLSLVYHLEHHAHPKVPCALLRADLDVTVSPLVEQNRARPAPLSWAQLCLDDRPRPRMRLRGAA
jgi:fatty acid desaturase